MSWQSQIMDKHDEALLLEFIDWAGADKERSKLTPQAAVNTFLRQRSLRRWHELNN